jgi:hypothetical protein
MKDRKNKKIYELKNSEFDNHHVHTFGKSIKITFHTFGKRIKITFNFCCIFLGAVA